MILIQLRRSWAGTVGLQNKIQAAIDSVQQERNKQSDLYLPGYLLHVTETTPQPWAQLVSSTIIQLFLTLFHFYLSPFLSSAVHLSAP